MGEQTEVEFDKGPEHERLGRLVGAWTGSAKTWFGPGAEAVEADWDGRIEKLLGGRFVRFQYRSSVQGKPLAGELILGWHRDERQWTATWIDSFHTGTDMMRSHGDAAEGPIAVRGSYFVGAEHPRWGWRTEIDDGAADRLAIRMYNITPEGQEALGVDVALRRVA
jgi:hypothetical protein